MRDWYKNAFLYGQTDKENKMSECTKNKEVDLSQYDKWVRAGDIVCHNGRKYLVSQTDYSTRVLVSLNNGNRKTDPVRDLDCAPHDYIPLEWLTGGVDAERVFVSSRIDKYIPLDYIPPEARKPKKKSELKWRDVTPGVGYDFYSENEFQKDGGKWQRTYRLVQFKLETDDEKGFPWETFNDRMYTTSKCASERVRCITEYNQYQTAIKLALDACNSWSAPVVIPTDFYNKLPCYVSEFNKKLNCGDNNV